MKIVFLECDALEATVRRPAFAHDWAQHGKLAPDAVVPALAGAAIAIVNKTPLRAAALAQLPELKLIAISATGTDNVDIAWCRAHGVAVCNIRNYAVHTVPEHTFALILALRRSLVGYTRDVAEGKWQRSEQFCLSGRPVNDIHGSTIGIFGEGALGQGVALLARGFGMRVLFADHPPPRAEGVDFTAADQVLRDADVVTLHAPLTAATRNLIGARELALMKRTAILINTGRGGLVDETALRGFRCADHRAAARRQSAARPRAAQFHPDAAHGMGEPGGDAGAGRSADRQHRGVRGGFSTQPGDLKVIETAVSIHLAPCRLPAIR